MKNEIPGKILLYISDSGKVQVNVFFSDENFWMTQKTISELFGVNIPAISKHIRNIYDSEELVRKLTISKMETVQMENERHVKRSVEYYNLDVIIAVGYRVNSRQATHFRRWATETLKQYIIKGFVLDDDMLKNGRPFGKDYFDDLLERIREIRASERRFYQKITDIFAQCSYDYDRNTEASKLFFQTVQNKMHFAITGMTAPEIVSSRADSEKPNMGLTTWKNGPSGKIQKSDVSIAKNYLDEAEIDTLNRIVSMYLDFAELQVKRQNPMCMKDWTNRLDAFLQFNEMEILKNAGIVSTELAKTLAESHYEKFRVRQDQEYISDFDQIVQKYLAKGEKNKQS